MRGRGWVALLLAAACSTGAPSAGPGGTPPRAAGEPPPTAPPPPPSPPARAVVLAAGTFELPAALAFGDPGFHEVLTATHTVPSDLGTTSGLRLVIALRDQSRPDVACGSEHPLSGCATVDWSDDPDRPNVPAGGVFDNSITLRLTEGPRTFFLSESGGLAGAPDPFVPG